jgi:hypothetical protein
VTFVAGRYPVIVMRCPGLSTIKIFEFLNNWSISSIGVCGRLRYCAIRMATGLICDAVFVIFQSRNSYCRALALGSTQPLTEMSTRNLPWVGGKGGRCVALTTLPPSSADCLKILEASAFWNLPSLSRPVQGKRVLFKGSWQLVGERRMQTDSLV